MSRLQKLEETTQMMSEQLTPLGTRKINVGISRCFTCGRSGRISQNCRAQAQLVDRLEPIMLKNLPIIPS